MNVVDHGARQNLGLAALVGLVIAIGLGLLLSAGQAGAGGGVALKPDLITLKPHKFAVYDEKVWPRGEVPPRKILDFGNRIANKGRGPLELFPLPEGEDCDKNGEPLDDRLVRQTVFRDTNGNKVFDRGEDDGVTRGVGCMFMHASHNHWHLGEIARYVLISEKSGKRATSVGKLSNCLLDYRPYDLKLPGAPENFYYPGGNCFGDNGMGLSVGWLDEYYRGYPGQQIDISKVRSGRYCFRSTADAIDQLDESNETNNSATARIVIDKANDKVTRLKGRCRLPR